MTVISLDSGNANGYQQTDENVAQDAVNETGFGRFNIKVMMICSLIFLNVALSVTSIGFILPSAACDFQMTTEDKGQMSAAPMIGMMFGSYIWGCYAAIKGRKKCLLCAVFLHGVAELLASVMPYYWGFLFLKFVSGAAMNGQSAVVFMYLGEFQPSTHRNRMLSWMETAWVSGMLVLAGVAWLIIPISLELEISGFHFHSWNLFVLICSLVPLLIGSWLTWFPETPKYLAETGQIVEMLEVLKRMYTENTGKPSKEYIARLQTCENANLVEFVNRATSAKDDGHVTKKSLKVMVREIVVNTVLVMKPPFLTRTVLMCLISCFVMSSYYTLTLWMPELFHRFASFEESYPNKSASVCTLTPGPNATNESEEAVCGVVQQSVFIDTFILGASCLPVGLILPVVVNFVEYKSLLVVTCFVPGIVTMCLFLVQSSTQNLILSCIYETITSVCISIIYCLLVDLYPTNLRTMASGLAALLSRVGAITGNLLIGYLIDNYCVLLIFIVAAQLLASGVLALFVPGRKKAAEKANS